MGLGEQASALLEVLADEAGDDVAVGVAVVDGADRVVRSIGDGAETGLYEIGSITKTMTATLLAAMVAEGAVALDDPVSRWLDAGPNGDITVEQLATHTSGLPRLAPNARYWDGFDPADPYAGYTAAMAEEGLAAAVRTNTGDVAYSNFGYQLLGLVLERASGQSYEKALRRRVLEPLGMHATCVRTAGAARLQGHKRTSSDGPPAPVPAWTGTLHGPGGVLATASDMGAYLAAVLRPPDGAIGDAISLALAPRVPSAHGAVGLTWQIADDGLCWHNGGTGGFRSMLAAHVGRGRGALALVASASAAIVDPATVLTARDDDPRLAVEQPIDDPTIVERARTLIGLVAARDWPPLREAMTTACRDALTPERLEAAWQQVMAPRGALTGAEVSRLSRSGGGISAEAVVRHADGDGTAKLYLTAAGELSGIVIA